MTARGRLGVWALVALIFVVAAVGSIHRRLPYAMIDLSAGQVHWLTASTIKYVDYWERDGFFTDRGLLLERPRSIETPDLKSRVVYASFLPGFAVEILLAHKLVPWFGLLNTILLFGIANQLLVCVVCGLIVRQAMADDESPWVAAYFVLAAMLFYLLHNAPSFIHATIYQAFQAEILPFSLVVLLESKLRQGRGDPRRLSHLLTLTIGWLSLVDWMWVTVSVVLSVLRLVSPLPSPAKEGFLARCYALFLRIWLLPLAIMASYACLLWQEGALGEMASHALLRSGVAAGARISISDFLGRDLVVGLGISVIYLAAAALIAMALLVRDRRDNVAAIALLTLLPCFLYVALLTNDSATHGFSLLKFYFAMVVAVGALVPYRVMQIAVGWSGSHRVAVKRAAMALIIFFSTFYLADLHAWLFWGEGWRFSFSLHLRQNPPPETLPLALWLRDNSRYDEVYFTLDSPIADNPPTALAISRKLVWQVDGPLQRYIEALPSDAVPRLVASSSAKSCITGEPLAAPGPGFLIYDGAKLDAAELACLDRLPRRR